MNTLAIFLAAAFCSQAVLGSYSHYHGPLAKPHVLKSGYLADTHEVAALKSAHHSALAQQSHGQEYGDSDNYEGDYGYGYSHDDEHLRYHGPTAIPHVLKDGHIADTHEVSAARAEHYAIVAKAKTHGGYGGDYADEQIYSGGYGSEGHHGHAVPYHGPKPHVLKSGYLADTHKVVAAKEHHLHALHSASHHGYDNCH